MKDLRVDLASFQGPLDLLLYLVQQEEVDIAEVPIARIADRFLEVCRSEVDSLDVDAAGEYLVMASQLLVLKSRALLPRDEPIDLEEIDPRLDLVRQLLEYRRYKGISSELAERFELQRRKAAVRLRKPAVEPEDEELELDLFGLVSAFQRLLHETGDDEAVAMPKERLPITHFVGHIFDELTAMGGRTGFRGLIGRQRDRTYVIGAFLALLELIKLRKVRVYQDGLGEIQIEIREDAAAPGSAEDEEAVARAIDEPELAEEEAPGPRVVFMGSPSFAVPALRALVGAGLAPRLVVTSPPQRAGRGRRARPVPVAREADALQLPLHRTNDVNGRTSRSEIEAARPDVIVTAGLDHLLGPALLEVPPLGCLSLHPSLLPLYRGPGAIAAAIRDGARQTGVSLFKLDEEADHGPLLGQRRVRLEGQETQDELAAKLAEAAADLLVRLIHDYLAGKLELRPQDDEAASYAPRLAEQDGVVDWSQAADGVRNQIRSVTSWPGARTDWQPKVKHEPLPLVLVRAETLSTAPHEEGEECRPGTVLAVGEQGIDVACGEGVLRVLALRAQDGRVQSAEDFLARRRVVAGDRFVVPREQPASAAGRPMM